MGDARRQVGARRLRNACLSYLAKLDEEETTALCVEQFGSASCMTDSLAALQALAGTMGAARDGSQMAGTHPQLTASIPRLHPCLHLC